MSGIKQPGEYTEMTYDDVEMDGSGKQGTIALWSVAALGTLTGLGICAHRMVNGYWIWDREAARAAAEDREITEVANNVQRDVEALEALEKEKKGSFWFEGWLYPRPRSEHGLKNASYGLAAART